jgi:hypothetical protein
MSLGKPVIRDQAAIHVYFSNEGEVMIKQFDGEENRVYILPENIDDLIDALKSKKELAIQARELSES